ncbi:hypothetical protein [Ferrimonas pelagia]|uniref:Uncharacterized protein n=1 Tax=Ferrimonas pelagia TaxID=1177826 RepID=A0ABP9F197_9GAMM
MLPCDIKEKTDCISMHHFMADHARFAANAALLSTVGMGRFCRPYMGIIVRGKAVFSALFSALLLSDAAMQFQGKDGPRFNALSRDGSPALRGECRLDVTDH